ncbi:MAG: hypothetical protein JNK48_00235 [Bryobacterales bacterium]|nr:hypothetical protein [Bryobacterales bacterium]
MSYRRLAATALGLLLCAPAFAQEKSKAKAPAKKTSVKPGGLRSPKEEFGKAGKSGGNYEKAGQAAGSGAKSLGTKTADGNIAGGAADFGKGVGTMGKEVGAGTAKVGSSVGRGVASVFGGGGKNKPKKSKAPAKK